MSDRLTDAGLDELLHGPGGVLDHEEPVFPWDRWTKSVFPSRLVSRAMWLAHKDTIMAEARPLDRPWGWWTFEGPKEPRIATRRCVDLECRHRDNPQA